MTSARHHPVQAAHEGRAPEDGAGQEVRPGRKRDASRDADILEATLDVLARVGYSGLTMDMVAAQAKAGKATVYRRWASRDALVIDAIAHMSRGMVDRDHLPDTGTLRGDLIALIRPQSVVEGEYRIKVMGGLGALLAQDPGLADAVNGAANEPWVEAHEVLIRRAIARGEYAEPEYFSTLTRVVSSMAMHRVLIQRQEVTRKFLISLIDGVLLPALRCAPAARAAREDAATAG
ncbi:MAG: TetR/AcrR family transcriptional regulator [Thermomicrobiales bacterium]|nr:TetR/AcrR family transcriptional regulator [Thermomicrobiales bacterium]